MAEDAGVGSGISSTTRSAENWSASIEMAADAENGEGDSDDDETVKRSPFSKKSSRLMGYFTSLRFDADSAPFAKK